MQWNMKAWSTHTWWSETSHRESRTQGQEVQNPGSKPQTQALRNCGTKVKPGLTSNVTLYPTSKPPHSSYFSPSLGPRI